MQYFLIIYSLVVDTSYLYNLANENGLASIRDISEQVFGIRLPETHDSVRDAEASLRAAVMIAKYGPAPPIVRAGASALKDALLVHKIPDYCTEAQLQQMMVDNSKILPVSVLPITRGGTANTGKTTIKFASVAHADLAFASIAGPVRPEKSNREQKRIYLKGGGYICVRKN